MEQDSKSKSGFSIENLILAESTFRRAHNVSKIEQGRMDIEVNVGINNDTISVAETVTLVQKEEDVEQVFIRATMVGVFKKIGDSEIDLEEFGNVNGAAIIFPYIREHISSLALKSGLGVLLLPPVNFTKKQS